MRTYRNFNEDYELGYEKGRKDALRRLNESKDLICYTVCGNQNVIFVFKTIESLKEVIDDFKRQGFNFRGYIVGITSGIKSSELLPPDSDNKCKLRRIKGFDELEYEIIERF